MAGQLFVRNMRPNATRVKFAGVAQTLTRRGTREDTTALPAEAANDPIISRFIRQGILEKLSKEAFMALGERTEDTRIPTRSHRDVAEEVAVQMNPEDSREPFLITDESMAASKHLRSPNIEFAKPVEETDVELGFKPRPVDPELATEVDTLRARLAEAEAELAEAKQANTGTGETETTPPKARKRTESGTKSTRARSRKKS